MLMTLLLFALAVLCFCLLEAASSRPGRCLPEGRMDVVYSLEVVTPHVKWADPYSRGPISAWLMPDVIGGRDVVEVAQRLGLVYDTLTLDKGGQNTWGFGDFYGRRGGANTPYDIDYQYLVEDMTSETHYDVLVVPSAHRWDQLPETARAALARRVEQGAGLVLVAPRCHPSHLDGLADLSPLLPVTDEGIEVTPDSWKEAKPVEGVPWTMGQPHYVTSGVPFGALPTDRMGVLPYRASGEVLVTADGAPVMAVKQYGEGRVVALGYDNFGFSPRVSDPWRCELTYPYWEYGYSLLCRAIVWAADREPAVRLSDLSTSDGSVRARIEGEKRPVTVTATFRDEQHVEQWTHREQAVAPATVGIPIPQQLNGGLQFADVIVSDGSGSLDWGTATFEVPRRVSILSVQPDRDVVQVGEDISAEVTLHSESAGPATVDVRFQDNRDRVLARARREIDTPGEVTLSLSLSTAHCLTRLGRVVCEVSEGGRLLDRKTASLFVRTPQVWDDYEITMDRFLPEPAPGRWPEIEKRLAEMDVSVMGAISPVMAEHVNFKIQADVVPYGFHPKYYEEAWNRSRKAYIETRDTQHLVRTPCFRDPEFRRKFSDDLARKVTSFVRFSPISYYAYEEPSLTHYRGGLDLCWCEHCLGGFREWLQQSYGTLEALNAEWGTTHATWEGVAPLTTEEAQESGRYAPWADFRTWMEVMWADTYRLGRDVIRGLDPHAIICLSGNQVGTPYNGYDYSRINHYIDQMQLYGSENLDEFNRSFYRGMLCTGCTGYGLSDPYVGLQLWGWLLNGNTAGVVIFWEISCLNPDLTFSKSGADLANHFAELRADGIARLLSTATRENCGIAIHYSYPSFHGTWATDGEIVDHEWANLSSRAFGLMNLDRIAWTQLLEGLGYQYDFVAYSQIEEGSLNEGGYRLLILPHSVALSDEEVRAIEEFAASGGIVISDLWPGVMNEHCTWRGAGALDALFGIEHADVRPEDFREGEARARVQVTDGEQGWCAGHDTVVRRRHGEGETIYVGASLAPFFDEKGLADPQQSARLSDLVSTLLCEVGLAPPASVTNRHGQPALTCESAHYRAGAADYFGIVRYPEVLREAEDVPDAAYSVPIEGARASLEPDDGTVFITFPERRHVYDVRARRYLGHIDRIETTLGYGDAGIYARLPYTVTGLEIDGPSSVSAGEAVSLGIQLAVSGDTGPGNHVAALRVYAPDGARCQHYESRVALPGGVGGATIPLALSDSAGTWRVVARDVATGTESERTFRVRA